jgi:hypothetical protein
LHHVPAFTAAYRPLFEEVWGQGSFAINFPSNTEQICSTPNVGGSATPVNLSPADRTRSNNDYDHWAQSLSAYEHSLSVSPFTSKFDAFLKGIATLTSDEMAGYNLPAKDWDPLKGGSQALPRQSNPSRRLYGLLSRLLLFLRRTFRRAEQA